ncbi:MAG: ester cyclase [Acidobacteriota bacterium]
MANHAAILGRRWFEEVWNERREEAIDELMAPDAVGHMEGGDVAGPQGFREVRAIFLNALPDMHITVEDVLSDGDQAVVRWRVRATHTGELLGVAPSQRKIDFRGMSWLTVRDGKLAEGWDTWNLGGLLDSLRST